MRYCCTNDQRGGTCYFEFQRGRFKGVWWKDTSICLDSNEFDRLHLEEILPPEFDYWDVTVITPSQWQQVCSKARNIGGEVQEVIEEIDAWAQNCFQTESVFSICGM